MDILCKCGKIFQTYNELRTDGVFIICPCRIMHTFFNGKWQYNEWIDSDMIRDLADTTDNIIEEVLQDKPEVKGQAIEPHIIHTTHANSSEMSLHNKVNEIINHINKADNIEVDDDNDLCMCGHCRSWHYGGINECMIPSCHCEKFTKKTE